MSFLFDLPVPAVPIVGREALFPVRRIWCVGRNYAEHSKEMGGTGREPPFFFAKPADAVVPLGSGGGEVRFPPRTSNCHHEVELVIAIGKAGSDIAVERATEHVFGCTVGVDLTRRDLQAELRENGRPWEMAKAFDQSAPVGALLPLSALPTQAAIWLYVNDAERQRSDIARMSWSVAEIVANLSTYVELRAGDLIFTGTPEGVGRVSRDDLVRCGIDGVGQIEFTMT